MIDTRKQTKLWPFERSVLEIFITFTSKPPTTEDALLQFLPFIRIYKKKQAGRLVEETQPSKLL